MHRRLGADTTALLAVLNASIKNNDHQEEPVLVEQYRLLVFERHRMAITRGVDLPYLQLEALIESLPQLSNPAPAFCQTVKKGLPRLASGQTLFSLIFENQTLTQENQVALLQLLLQREYCLYYKELTRDPWWSLMQINPIFRPILEEVYLLMLTCNENDLSRKAEIALWKSLITEDMYSTHALFSSWKGRLNNTKRLQFIEVWMSQLSEPIAIVELYDLLMREFKNTVFGNKFGSDLAKIAKTRILMLEAEVSLAPQSERVTRFLEAHRSRWLCFGVTKSASIHRLFQHNERASALSLLEREKIKTEYSLSQKMSIPGQFIFN